MTPDWVSCDGQAHQAGVIQDNCMSCTPYWSQYPVCPLCRGRVRPNSRRATVHRCQTQGCPYYRAGFDVVTRSTP